MGFFKDFKRDFAQAVNELMPDKDELANEYDDEDIVNTFDEDDIDIAPEDMLENIDDIPSSSVKNTDKSDMGFGGEGIGTSYIDTGIADSEEAVIDEEETPSSEEDAIKDIPEAEIIGDNYTSDMDIFEDGEEEQEEELLEALPPEEFETQSDIAASPDTESESAYDEAALGDDELKALDALDEVNMTENLADAEAIEPTASGFEGIDIGEAVADAISKNEAESEADRYEEGTEIMAETVEEKIIEEESIKEKEQDANSILADDTTYITKGTTIKGNITTDGGIDVIGTVEGDVQCGGKLIIGGTIEGNITAGEIYANAAKLKGEIVTEGSVKIGVGTVVVGNVTATSAVIAGAVNGDIDVQGPVIVDSTAVIMGDIKSRSVQINNGAVIEGRCSQCYSEIDVKSFFE